MADFIKVQVAEHIFRGGSDICHVNSDGIWFVIPPDADDSEDIVCQFVFMNGLRWGIKRVPDEYRSWTKREWS